ncbi:MAG: chemotaxis protein CheA [Pseudomonadota bacterium]
MNEFIEQFIIECHELIEQATAALLTLENSPRDTEALDSLFRAFHTLKGSAAIMDFVVMERLLHTFESALSELKSNQGTVSNDLNGDCLACLDLIGRWLDVLESAGELPADAEAQANALLTRLNHDFQQTDDASQPQDHGALTPEAHEASAANTTLPQVARDLLTAQIALLDEATAATFIGCVASAGNAASNVLVACGLPGVAELVARATAKSLTDKDAGPLRTELLQALSAAVETPQAVAATAPRPPSTVRTLRIDADKVELLVRLVGELTIIKNALGHVINTAQADANPIAGTLKDQHGVLDRITSEVQRTVVGMRVLPLRTVLGRFPPVMRDMAASLGKPAKLLIEGDETEADKAIVEMLFEPLLHVVRNAMDHGIESASARAQSNKPPVATIVMRAYRQGDRVLIDVVDDGKGIDVARIRQVATERGVVTPERLAELTEADIIDLVFAPGFSTATKVTEISGRGVGMDAVRTSVGRVGGSVSIESRAGQGTTVRFSLPFSVMMTQVMTVEAGGQTFGIPLDAVIETIRVPVNTLIGVGAAHAIAHRNRTLPVFELANLLHVQSPAVANDDAIIVITSFAGQWGGIRVDRIGERMEVMLKPLEGLLGGVPGITGTTIMGDGRVLLVLDLGEILL